MKKLNIYDNDNDDKSCLPEQPEESSFLQNFKRQDKTVLFAGVAVLIGVGLIVGIALLKEKSITESAQKSIPENESTKHARKTVEILRQIPRNINPDQDNAAETLNAVCTSAKQEFAKINPNELEISIQLDLLDSFSGCWRAITDARDPLVVPEDIEDIPRTLKYKEIRDKSFRENIAKFLGEREGVAKKLGM